MNLVCFIFKKNKKCLQIILFIEALKSMSGLKKVFFIFYSSLNAFQPRAFKGIRVLARVTKCIPSLS
jgi:hypothetical protein